MLVAGFCLLCFSAFIEKSKPLTIWRNKRDAIQLLLFSITGMLAVQYTYFAAIKNSNAATATVLQCSGPIVIALYLAAKYRRLPARIELLAIALAVSGTFLLVTHGNLNSLAISGTALFFGLASAVTLAVYTLQPIALLSKYNASVVIGWGMLCGGLAFSLVRAPWNVQGYWDWQTWMGTGFVVIFGTLIAFYAYMTAVKLIGGQKSSLLASAEPLSATILAVLWLQTSFELVDCIGSICIVSTVFLLSYGGKKQVSGA